MAKKPRAAFTAPVEIRLREAPPVSQAARTAPRTRLVAKTKPISVSVSIELPKGALLGAHTSTSGGVTQAIARAQASGFTAAQIFVKNNKQWFAGPLAENVVQEFRAARKKSGILFFAHNSYLINLASQDPAMFATSIRAMIEELQRAEALGLPFIVMHPGSHGGAGEEAGLARIVDGLNEVVAATPGFRCRMALEITAGQGNALGYRLEHLGALLERVKVGNRFGVCLDTAHLFAAGYNLCTRPAYEKTMQAVETILGRSRVLAFHLNDSKVALGKRVDRHALLGEGEIGAGCFQWLVADPRWARVPKILETPKSEDMHEDVESLRKLAPYLR